MTALFGQVAYAEARPLQVAQNFYLAAVSFRPLANNFRPARILGVRTVRKIEPGNVNTFGNESFYLFFGFGRRPDGGDNFSFTSFKYRLLPLQYHLLPP